MATLPRRIGFSTPFKLTLDNGHELAREYGQRGRAAVVLWGRLLRSEEAKPRVAINVTFIESEALFKKFGSELIGVMEASELDGLDSNVDRLAESLPRFLNGYRRYHAAKRTQEVRYPLCGSGRGAARTAIHSIAADVAIHVGTAVD